MEAMMAAPYKVAPETVELLVEEWLQRNAIRVGQGYEHLCPAHGTIQFYEAYMSIHTPFPGGQDECMGMGHVKQVRLPVCIACHPEPPEQYGCIHIRDHWDAPHRLPWWRRLLRDARRRWIAEDVQPS
jgi:hypothetical protein